MNAAEILARHIAQHAPLASRRPSHKRYAVEVSVYAYDDPKLVHSDGDQLRMPREGYVAFAEGDTQFETREQLYAEVLDAAERLAEYRGGGE